MRPLHALLGLLAMLFIGLIVVANQSCAPKYFERGDVRAILAIAAALAVLLAYAASADDDRRRMTGSASSAGLLALLLSTASLPMLVAPAALIGVLRLPRSRSLRVLTFVVAPIVAVLTVAVPYLGQASMTPDQFRCP
jgi:hypothetical protein